MPGVTMSISMVFLFMPWTLGNSVAGCKLQTYNSILASSATPENVKQNLRTGTQWAIILSDGSLGVVGPGFECVRNPDIPCKFTQCGDVAEVAVSIVAPAIARTQPPLTTIALTTDEPNGARDGLVAFASTDGTAAYGSRSVFILRNVQSGEAMLVPVLGAGASTLTEAFVRPGTYDVVPPAPSVDGYKSYSTSKISETRITVVPGGIPAIVDFSLAVQIAPVIMRASKVTSSSVALEWGAISGANVRSYTVVRSDGDTEAPSDNAGVVVANVQANTNTVVAQGLAPNRKYTFTLFSTAADGTRLPTRSVTASTARVTGETGSSYALAPNTITPRNYASLRVQPVSQTSIRVALPANLSRGSRSKISGIADASLDMNGCVVGTPFLVTTDVAGDQSFYGLIDACEGSASGATSAIVNRDVPLAAVFDYFMISTGGQADCFNAMTGKPIAGGTEACSQIVEQSGRPDGATTTTQSPGQLSGPPMGSRTLPFSGQTDLERDQRYWSQTGSHYLVFQEDGNLVVYRADGGYIWGLDRQPGTDFGRIARVTWQADGNLAAYSAEDEYVWSALTRDPDPTARLLIDPQGVLQIIAGQNVMWRASNPQALRGGEDDLLIGDTNALSLAEQGTATGLATLTNALLGMAHQQGPFKGGHYERNAKSWSGFDASYNKGVVGRESRISDDWFNQHTLCPSNSNVWTAWIGFLQFVAGSEHPATEHVHASGCAACVVRRVRQRCVRSSDEDYPTKEVQSGAFGSGVELGYRSWGNRFSQSQGGDHWELFLCFKVAGSEYSDWWRCNPRQPQTQTRHFG